MKILGNLTRGLIPHKKQLLYRCCALPITLYRFQLWFYTEAPLSFLLKILGKLQRHVALWIMEAFKTSPLLGVEAIAGLIPIHLHLKKLSGRSELKAHSLPSNHILWFLMRYKSDSSSPPYPLSLSMLTACQCNLIRGHLVDMDN